MCAFALFDYHGSFATSIGTEHMRCKVEMDSSIVYFPALLRENGYFTTLRFKKDYNASCPKNVWDKDDFWDINESLEGRKEKQPFFIFYNTWISHETRLHHKKTAIIFSGQFRVYRQY
ncbi:hypothetical protein [Persicobacter diffluens]